MPKKYRRRAKQEIATADAQPLVVDNPFASGLRPAPDGAPSVAALTEVLQALTTLPSDRAKARVLRFVQDYFDERHGH